MVNLIQKGRLNETKTVKSYQVYNLNNFLSPPPQPFFDTKKYFLLTMSIYYLKDIQLKREYGH